LLGGLGSPYRGKKGREGGAKRFSEVLKKKKGHPTALWGQKRLDKAGVGKKTPERRAGRLAHDGNKKNEEKDVEKPRLDTRPANPTTRKKLKMSTGHSRRRANQY